ncbi:hypothetical protein KR52_04975 [Synechococcus sp. KORDI-52]|nr:hypothetical protein KR52_04975 [Synechococcus sp. KORDI-52]
MKRHNLLYGRVPKAANSSIKAALCRLLSERPPKGTKTTSDRFWQHETNQETELITLRRARKYRRSHFSFSFVRNPFDRLIAAYNNKVIEIEEPPLPMQNMGITHGMSFDTFLDVLIETPFKHYDVHVLPQNQLLCIGNQIVPKFVGRVEQINEHWAELRDILARRGIEVMESLPQKNVRRSDRGSLQNYFNNDSLINKTMQIYGDDVHLFYNDVSVEDLIQNTPLPAINPLHSKGLKLSNWLRSHGFWG